MAFVEKRGNSFAVIQGNNGRVLSRFGNSDAAKEEVSRLHSKNKPSTSNRGKSAQKRHKARDN